MSENGGHWNSGYLFQTKPYLKFNLEKPPKPKQFFLTILKSNRRYRTKKLKFLNFFHRFFHSNNTVYESTVPHQPHVVSNKPPNLPTSPVPPPGPIAPSPQFTPPRHHRRWRWAPLPQPAPHSSCPRSCRRPIWRTPRHRSSHHRWAPAGPRPLF